MPRRSFTATSSWATSWSTGMECRCRWILGWLARRPIARAWRPPPAWSPTSDRPAYAANFETEIHLIDVESGTVYVVPSDLPSPFGSTEILTFLHRYRTLGCAINRIPRTAKATFGEEIGGSKCERCTVVVGNLEFILIILLDCVFCTESKQKVSIFV